MEPKLKNSPEPEPYRPGGKTPWRLRMGTKLWALSAINGKVSVEGIENIEKIPQGKRTIIACSHVTDGDVPSAMSVLSDHFDFAIANQRTHQQWGEEPIMKLAVVATGSKNFFPIDYAFSGTEKKRDKIGSFNPDNYQPMKEVMKKEGKALFIAAHSPTYGGLPEKGGLGAIYLAQITDNSILLPVASDLVHPSGHVMNADENIKSLLNRPTAKVIIGKPFELPKIEGIENLPGLIKRKEVLSEEERMEWARLMKALKIQSDDLMKRISCLLPQEKRGNW
jgi:hypothetical protein